jgi:predicted DNA-binding protein
MSGLEYLTNEKGKKTALVIRFDEFGELIEDIEDLLIAHQRLKEEQIPLDQVKENLQKYGKLDV